jgi:signal transduction histidine kinase
LVAGSTRDITERKSTEEKLRQSEERLRELAESLEKQERERTAMLEEQNQQIRAQTSQLQRLSVQLMNVKDNEGRRIARELHDSSGQFTAALLMNLGMLAKNMESADAALTSLVEGSIAYARELDREIRTTSYLLHPPMLDEIGLSAALRWYLQGLKQRASLEVELLIQEDFGRLPADAELTIFRIVQECMTNVHRHSGSRSASVEITREEGVVLLAVADTGRGIAAKELANLLSEGSGVGLRGIRERIRSLNGDLRVESEQGRGTTVIVTLPINDQPSVA